jgi:hypothetical protein
MRQILRSVWLFLVALGIFNLLLSFSSEHVSALFSFSKDMHDVQAKDNWKALQHKRTLVVQFASVERLKEFNLYWRSHELHLLGNMNNASLLLACPSMDASKVMEQVIKYNNWTLVGTYTHHHPLAYGNLLQFQTPNGVDILFQPIVITLPRSYMNNPTIPTCADKTWSLSYAMYSGAVFSYHLMELPFLSKYDFYMKVDTDIEFSSDIPFDITEDMSSRNCLIGHTSIQGSGSCEDGNLKALLQGTKVLGFDAPKSVGYNWCNENGDGNKGSLIFYGNFLVFSTKVLLHPDVVKMRQYMYEEYTDGYFTHRWGDQAPSIMYICQALDIPDLRNDTQICDYSRLRDSTFTHHRIR